MPFVVFYSAREALQGIGVGILVDEVNGLPQTERATGADLVPDLADNILVRNLGVSAASEVSPCLDYRSDRNRRCPPPPRRCAGIRRRHARRLRLPHHGPPTALRTGRAGPLQRRRLALRAKPTGSPGARSAGTAGFRAASFGRRPPLGQIDRSRLGTSVSGCPGSGLRGLRSRCRRMRAARRSRATDDRLGKTSERLLRRPCRYCFWARGVTPAQMLRSTRRFAIRVPPRPRVIACGN